MNLLQQNYDRYIDDYDFLRLISKYEMCIHSDFLHNKDGIDIFWQKYYRDGVPKVVLCGNNPSRLEGVMTGIPFMDYQSLSHLITVIDRQDTDRTAGFFFQVISQFGVEEFFQRFYVTNILSVKFIGDKANINYCDLPPAVLEVVERNFLQEMEIVQPTHIISLGKVVQQTVRKLLPKSIDCSLRLPHPSWITTYRSKEIDKWKAKYLEALDIFQF